MNAQPATRPPKSQATAQGKTAHRTTSERTTTPPGKKRLAGGLTAALLALGFSAGGVIAPAAAADCIPDDNISYTYDAASNSGVLTVEDDEGSTGVTCDPLYLIAASWRMDNPPERWPQTLDIVNVYPAITTPGTYEFGAAVTCGQGDIYASHEPLEYPTPTLTAPSTPYEENFLSGDDLSDISGPDPTRAFLLDACATPTPTPTPSETAIPTPSPTPQVGGVTVDRPSTPQLGAGAELPSTGIDATPALAVAGGLLLVGIAALVLRRRRAAAGSNSTTGPGE